MAKPKTRRTKTAKTVTRYTYDKVKEPRTPETGHTALLPGDEQVVTLPMDNGWSRAIDVGRLPAAEDSDPPVVVDMDPAADPVLFWAGKRNRRDVPLLPLQRNEIVSESRIAGIIERARLAVAQKEDPAHQRHLFADLERELRHDERKRRVEFYTHDEGWKNKLICGDSLHVMESLLHYEGLRGKVQMIYIDPPYGIKYNSNFQQRVDSIKNDEKDRADDVLTIRAFRDTWALGIHSYLSYLGERLYLCRELLAESGSVFVQIGEDTCHVVRTLLDEVFGTSNYVRQIVFRKTGGKSSELLDGTYDVILWYAKDVESAKSKYQQLYVPRDDAKETQYRWIEKSDGTVTQLTPGQLKGDSPVPPGRRFLDDNLTSQDESSDSFSIEFAGRVYESPAGRHWSTGKDGIDRLISLNRLVAVGNWLKYKRYIDDMPVRPLTDQWQDTVMSTFSREKVYAVQTPEKAVQRCILMATSPGDIVLDPTCGSGTTAFCSERSGRRWITCDTSRVAINVARQRLLGATFLHYETRNGHVSSGFRYKTVSRVTLKSLAYDLEPEQVELVDQPEVDKGAIRICGPFEAMTLGRYSVEDWKGWVVRERPDGADGRGAARLENYIETICRLYRRDAAVQGATGLVHAVAESEGEKVAVSVGPLSGRVTAKQINDAVQDALASGILEVHVLGWAFEANVGEVKSQLEKRGRVKVELIMIRPDTLAEGLKAVQPDMLFSPLALPDIEVETSAGAQGAPPQAAVTLKGLALFDRKTRGTQYRQADSGYVSAWYLDEDYDGDCFVDCQMFFDFRKKPARTALGVDVEAHEFEFKVRSEPFPLRDHRRIAVRVVDVYGNESTLVKDLR